MNKYLSEKKKRQLKRRINELSNQLYNDKGERDKNIFDKILYLNDKLLRG